MIRKTIVLLLMLTTLVAVGCGGPADDVDMPEDATSGPQAQPPVRAPD
jgi:hypothetical protein